LALFIIEVRENKFLSFFMGVKETENCVGSGPALSYGPYTALS
jgi:hypothetical protein